MADIVEAGPAHANAIARLHAENWKMSYRGILPDAYLDKEVDGERLAYWQEALAKDRYSMVRVALDKTGEIAGFSGLKVGVDKGYDQTIEHLHVSACARGTGLGRALMADAAHQTMAHGGNSLCLWVFEDNAKAIGFYEALGGVTDAHGTDKFAGGDAPDRRIGWRDLTLLVAVCEGEGK
jgi:ribosomal protein S18 acetylase RimI-like enzyme